ncbi:MAG: recombinase family protein, partial [Defluviitaleaceae bacterium]|nr:recombinase family protein [Defluviitaleaceae bacterium]
EKTITPRDYYYQREGRPNPYRQNHMWNDVTIRKILRNEVYIGNTVQNKTGTLSYKNKKMVQKPKEDWVRVEGTHEPIITLEVWEQVCKIDNAPSRPKRTGNGEISLFGGLVYCLDCGFAMRYQQEQHKRKNGNLVVYKSYMCGSYSRSGKAACTSHIIYIDRLSEIVIADIKQKAALLVSDEQTLLERVGQTKAAESKSQFDTLNAAKRAAENRRAELERLIQSLYEDKVKGKITEDVCARLINQYEVERREKADEVQILTAQIDGFRMEQSNTQEWISLIRQFQDIEVLSRDILLKLIDKVEIGEREIIGNQKQREIRIHYKFVGYIG